MRDVQSGPARVPLAIDRVGVKNLRLPIVVRDRARGVQNTVADVDLSVDLPAAFKGTHMSRFVEALGDFSEGLDYDSFRNLLAGIARKLSAQRAFARFSFPFFMEHAAPATGSKGKVSYACEVEGEYTEGKLTFILGVRVPVMTVCPCSLAISEIGAHSQRALIRIRARFEGFLWLEDLIEVARSAGSQPVYSLLKRLDEKVVTEAAFAEPAFVEDVVRAAAKGLADHAQVTWFRVEVESFESIHDHSAYARIEQDKRGPASS